MSLCQILSFDFLCAFERSMKFFAVQVCDIGEILSVRPNLTKDSDSGCFFTYMKVWFCL